MMLPSIFGENLLTISLMMIGMHGVIVTQAL